MDRLRCFGSYVYRIGTWKVWASLPESVNSTHVERLAESILRTANSGERSAAVLERIALMELQITPRD